jgi:hypothetical protein
MALLSRLLVVGQRDLLGHTQQRERAPSSI